MIPICWGIGSKDTQVLSWQIYPWICLRATKQKIGIVINGFPTLWINQWKIKKTPSANLSICIGHSTVNKFHLSSFHLWTNMAAENNHVQWRLRRKPCFFSDFWFRRWSSGWLLISSHTSRNAAGWKQAELKTSSWWFLIRKRIW